MPCFRGFSKFEDDEAEVPKLLAKVVIKGDFAQVHLLFLFLFLARSMNHFSLKFH